MPWVHTREVAEGKQDTSDRTDERCMVATRQVRATDRSGEERVADEQIRSGRVADLEADAAWAMPRRVMRSYLEPAARDDLPGDIEVIDRRRGIDSQSEHLTLFDRPLVEKQIVVMEVHRNVQGARGRADPRDVIDMCVCQQNSAESDLLAIGKCQQSLHLVAWVDQHAFPCARTRHDEPVLEEWADGPRLDYDHGVILAILDDLMFSSKIKTAAKQLGVPLSVVRSSEGALAEMRAHLPTLVIFDLNNPRTDPIGTVSSMKADPTLAAIPTVGFSQHTLTDTIEAARKAGVGEVLARGAFFERLPDLLARAR
jgi:CheY-like chemotaxis protein